MGPWGGRISLVMYIALFLCRPRKVRPQFALTWFIKDPQSASRVYYYFLIFLFLISVFCFACKTPRTQDPKTREG